MTIVYGVTRFGARLQILKQLKDLEGFPKEYTGQASTYLTMKTFDCIREMFSSAKEIQVSLEFENIAEIIFDFENVFKIFGKT